METDPNFKHVAVNGKTGGGNEWDDPLWKAKVNADVRRRVGRTPINSIIIVGNDYHPADGDQQSNNGRLGDLEALLR